jgi:hypothetical protein
VNEEDSRVTLRDGVYLRYIRRGKSPATVSREREINEASAAGDTKYFLTDKESRRYVCMD